MIEKERIINELNIKSFETKNENKWNEQTILHITPWFTGIINFPLDKLDDNMFSHIKTIIESMDSLDKTARKHLEENSETNKKKDFWDVLSTAKRIEHNNVYLICVIFYSDFTFCLKYSVSNECKEKICPGFIIGFNFTKDFTLESLFSEIFPYINFKFSGYPLINPDMDHTKDIEGIIKEISIFNGKYQQCANNNLTEENYAWCPQYKTACVSISLDKLRPYYIASVKYAHKNIPVNSSKINGIILQKLFRFEGIGTLRTNSLYPIKWLKKHNQECSGIISIPVKDMEHFYLNCEIQNYEIRKMEIIEDADICRKLENGIFKEDKL
jgi:hypothetical protein